MVAAAELTAVTDWCPVKPPKNVRSEPLTVTRTPSASLAAFCDVHGPRSLLVPTWSKLMSRHDVDRGGAVGRGHSGDLGADRRVVGCRARWREPIADREPAYPPWPRHPPHSASAGAPIALTTVEDERGDDHERGEGQRQHDQDSTAVVVTPSPLPTLMTRSPGTRRPGARSLALSSTLIDSFVPITQFNEFFETVSVHVLPPALVMGLVAEGDVGYWIWRFVHVAAPLVVAVNVVSLTRLPLFFVLTGGAGLMLRPVTTHEPGTVVVVVEVVVDVVDEVVEEVRRASRAGGARRASARPRASRRFPSSWCR